VRESLSEIDNIIRDIKSGKSTDVTTAKLLGLKSGFVRFGEDRQWSS
jgi:hypothetical protein